MQFRKDLAHYNWCVETLREAYMNDTLVAGHPCGCDIGNLIFKKAVELGIDGTTAYDMSSVWHAKFHTGVRINSFDLFMQKLKGYSIYRTEGTSIQFVNTDPHFGADTALAILQLEPQVLLDLEWAFEINQKGDSADERMFNGLLASIKVLDEYFGIADYAQEWTKEKFVQVHKSKSNVMANTI